MFKIAFRETGNGLDACKSCELLPTKFPETANDDEEIELLIFQVELIIEAEDAGLKTNWEIHGADLMELAIEYRKAEKEVKLLFDIRQQLFLKAHFKEK